MIESVFQHLTEGLRSLGLPERRILRGIQREEAYRTAPAAMIQPVDGAVERDGQRVRAQDPTTIKRLWGGQARVRVELYARTPDELQSMLVGLLRWMYTHPYHDPLGQSHRLPDGDVRLAWVDEDGVVLGENVLALEIPVELGIYETTGWVPVTVVLEYEIEGGNSGE